MPDRAPDGSRAMAVSRARVRWFERDAILRHKWMGWDVAFPDVRWRAIPGRARGATDDVALRPAEEADNAEHRRADSDLDMLEF